jgi:hypothetical protein
MYETVPSFEKASCIYEYQYNYFPNILSTVTKYFVSRNLQQKEKARNRLHTNVVLKVKMYLYVHEWNIAFVSRFWELILVNTWLTVKG